MLLPLGGTGEIGMNCYCYGIGAADDREWLMVDLGVKFGEATEPGIDLVLPDVSFIAKNRNAIWRASCSPTPMRTISAPCPGCGRSFAARSIARPLPPRSSRSN